MGTYLRLLTYLRPYRARFTAALACMVLYAVMSAVSLGTISPFMQVLFERVGRARVESIALPGATAPAEREALAREPFRAADIARWPALLRARVEHALVMARPLVALERICLFLVIALFLKNLADFLQAFLMISVEQAAIRDLRAALLAHLQRMSLGYFHARRTGNLMARVTNDVEYLREALATGISRLVKGSLTLIGCLAWAFYASWRLALLSMLVLPPVLLALALLGRKLRKRSDAAQQRMGDLNAILQENIAGVRIVKAFGMERFEQTKFERANEAFYRAFVHMRRLATAAGPVGEFGMVLAAVAMLWLGGVEIFSRHSLAPAQFVLFVTALVTTTSPIRSLSEVNANIQQGLAAARRLFELLDTPADVTDRPGARALAPFRDRIRYENVTFAYDGDRPVLENVSLEVRRGEVVALVGSSGAGKSTTMDLLPRFYDPGAGRITIDGVDVRDATLASLRAQLGIVTQETIVFHDTVRNNIAYGSSVAGAEREGAVEAAAAAANADAFIRGLPHGYDTVIGDRGVRLSGGERQRIAIARALLKNSPVLLLDEATSALDTESERLVQQALERLMRDRTVLVIAHRLSTVQHADRIVVLEKGRVAASGTHAELLDQDGLYRRLYDLQFVA
ncbi:MAG: ABC transporter ATP-binding protein [Candidatus Eisenbacteria bacterium]|nr:ABC transporter ATP-binding protein [Candidatus Eisenbacteria bacterium]